MRRKSNIFNNSDDIYLIKGDDPLNVLNNMSRVGFTEAIRKKTVQNMSTAMRPSRKLRLVFNLLCDLFVFNMKMQ